MNINVFESEDFISPSEVFDSNLIIFLNHPLSFLLAKILGTVNAKIINKKRVINLNGLAVNFEIGLNKTSKMLE